MARSPLRNGRRYFFLKALGTAGFHKALSCTHSQSTTVTFERREAESICFVSVLNGRRRLSVIDLLRQRDFGTLCAGIALSAKNRFVIFTKHNTCSNLENHKKPW